MNRPVPSHLVLQVSTRLAGALIPILLVGFLGCAGINPKSKQAKRSQALMARDRAVATVEGERPGERDKIKKAAGYAVFASGSDAPYELPPGYGFGVVHEKSSGKNTFLLAVRQGPDANVPMPTSLLVFETQKALANFTQAAMAARDKNPAALPLDQDVEVWKLLEAGGVAQGSTINLRYWYDGDVGG